MTKPQDMRELITLLENVEESARRSRSSYFTSPKDTGARGVENRPIPHRPHGNRPTTRVFFDKENPDPKRRLPFQHSYDIETGTDIYTADNGTNTIGPVNANKLRQIFAKKGKQEGKDYEIDTVHGILKVFGTGPQL